VLSIITKRSRLQRSSFHQCIIIGIFAAAALAIGAIGYSIKEARIRISPARDILARNNVTWNFLILSSF